MSILSTLTLLASPLLRRSEPHERDASRNELKDRVALLECEIDRMRSLVEALRGADRYERQLTMLQAHAASQLQHSLLGAQNLSQAQDFVCNCVPARHDLFLNGANQ